MPSNWIVHTPSTTPHIKTDEDVIDMAPAHITQFYVLVQAEFVHGATKSGGYLPPELQERASACEAGDLALVLREAIVEGVYMDSGWTVDYWSICERIAGVMGGYPKKCLRQWRAVKDSIAGRLGDAEIDLGNVNAKNDGAFEKDRAFRFLDLPEHLRARIYRFLVPSKTLVISDWNFASVPKTMYKRTEYEVPDEHGSMRRTTYVVHSNRSTVITPQLDLMLANRTLYQEMAELLYNECTFEFRGTAASTLAFLHDHMKVISRLKRISVKYTTTSKTQKFLGCTMRNCTPPPTLKTNLNIWKKIVNVLMLSACSLEDLEMVIDKSFWERAEWERGVDAVIADTALCESRGRQPVVKNFLVDICVLSGVNFRLAIDGSVVSRARKEFCRDLEKAMFERIRRRPYLAEKNAKCSCRKRLLNEACAWDGEEKKRRL